MSALFTFWTHGDLVDLQKQLASDLAGTQQSVAACTKLDSATAASWAAFYQSVLAFTQDDAAWVNTGTQADQGQAYQRELYAWQQKLSATCTLTVPSVNPDKGKDMSGINTALKWGAVIAGFLGTAYIVGKIAPIVPRSAPREEKP